MKYVSFCGLFYKISPEIGNSTNGRLLKNNLKVLGKDEKWLKKQLSAKGISDHSQVYIMVADRDNNIYLSSKENSK